MTDTRTAQEMVEPADYWSRPLVDRLKERAAIARSEGTGTAIADAGHFDEAATLIASLTEENERLVSGLSALVHCQSALSRSQMREAAAGLLTDAGRKAKRFEDRDQSPFVLRALAAEAALAKDVEEA